MSETMLSMVDFIKTVDAKMSATWTDRNPNMPDSDNMDHWKCVIRVGRKAMTVVFSMGIYHCGKEPKLADVLECLASDASSAAETFEDWCDGLGYDTDSRRAERAYQACVKTHAKLDRLLGSAALNTLLYETER